MSSSGKDRVTKNKSARREETRRKIEQLSKKLGKGMRPRYNIHIRQLLLRGGPSICVVTASA